ncbi:hypothetical protein D3C86_1835920 [compost metagenome]
MQGFDEHDDAGQQCHHQAAQGYPLGDRALERTQDVDQVGFGSDDHGGLPAQASTWTGTALFTDGGVRRLSAAWQSVKSLVMTG